MGQRIWLITKILCTLALTIGVSLVLIELRQVLRGTRASLIRLDSVIQHVDEAAVNASAASKVAADAAVEQKKYFSMISLQSYKIATDLKGFIVRTDLSVNRELVPRIAKTLDSTNGLTVQASESLRQTTESLQPAIADLTRAASNAADALGDPAIRSSLSNVEETTANVADTTKQLDLTATDLRLVADNFRETYLKPGRTLLATLKTLIHLVFETRGALQK